MAFPFLAVFALDRGRSPRLPLTVSLRFGFMENIDCHLFLLATLGFVQSVQLFIESRSAVIFFSVDIELAVDIYTMAKSVLN